MKREVAMNPAYARPCRHRAFWVVIVALLVVLAASLALNLAAVETLSGSARPVFDDRGEDEFPQFAETHSCGAGTSKVVRIWFAGVLTRELDGGWLGTVDPVEDCLRQIRAARQDPDVAGIPSSSSGRLAAPARSPWWSGNPRPHTSPWRSCCPTRSRCRR